MFHDLSSGIPEVDDEEAVFRRNVETLEDTDSELADMLFPPKWVMTKSGYSSFHEFVDAEFGEYDRFSDIPVDELDEWVAEETPHDSWDELEGAAARHWLQREFY